MHVHGPVESVTDTAVVTILFLHGSDSVPGGQKPSYFLEHGHRVLNPALPADNFQRALDVAQIAYDVGRPDLVVGSSRGGALAMNIQVGDTPLLLICPAWKKWGKAGTVKAGTVIMHSLTDEIIPHAFSQELVKASPGVRLIDAGTNHRMADQETLATMLRVSVELCSGASK